VPAGAPLVDDVSADAFRWARAMERAAEIARSERKDAAKFVADFADIIVDAYNKNPRLNIPDVGDREDTKRTLLQFRDCGLDLEDLRFAIMKAMTMPRLHEDNVWKYFCGICWRMVKDRQETARALIEAEDVE
jgi:hypothetical protein